jgi:hypothetical protein
MSIRSFTHNLHVLTVLIQGKKFIERRTDFVSDAREAPAEVARYLCTHSIDVEWISGDIRSWPAS